MSLEGRDNVPRERIEVAGRGDTIAVARERLLQSADRASMVAECERAAVTQRGRLDPMTHAGRVQASPGKFLAGILLARRCHVGMRQHAVGWNAVARND